MTPYLDSGIIKMHQKNASRTSADVWYETLNLLVLGSTPSGLTNFRAYDAKNGAASGRETLRTR